jgi:hypothetical protein
VCTAVPTPRGHISATATGFAGIALDRAVLAEVITTLGSIPIADTRPSTEAAGRRAGK